jgi:RNA polymerase sigma-70 factor (ECF subfamily)
MTELPLSAAIPVLHEVVTHRTRAPSTGSKRFSELFERMAPLVWGTLRHLGVREADLPDLCQEVFVVVHRRLPDFDESRSSLQTWIYGICLRRASQYRRRAAHLREVSEAEVQEPSLIADQESALERKRAREWLDVALERVGEHHRTVFVLYEMEELPMKTIAAVLGCPLQTAYFRLHRARDEVEKAFRALAKGRPTSPACGRR